MALLARSAFMLFMSRNKLKGIIMWFKSWWQTWKLARQAKAILENAEEHNVASFRAKTILTALAERKPICRNCFNPHEVKVRSFAERFQVRAILLIPDNEPDPMLCDDCFKVAVATHNPQATNIGTSYSGHANMALKHLR